MAIVLCVTCGGLGQKVYAQCETKILASDGDDEDCFGNYVSIDGDVMVVGACADADNGRNSGSVYVFRNNGLEWIEEAKLLPSNGDEEDVFGRSVSIEGDVLVVGAPCANGCSGLAYVYRYVDFKWVEEAILPASDGDAWDLLGESVSINNDVIVVGATGDDDNGKGSGSAYVFRYNGSEWVEEAKLLGHYGDRFGRSVSIEGDTILVGAINNSEKDDEAGSVSVYRYDGADWVEEAKLLASDGYAWDHFGISVSIDGNATVIGTRSAGDNGIKSGSAYVFRRVGSVWAEEAKLQASDGAERDGFGWSVSMNGDVIVVGTYGDDDNGNGSGAAYVYRYDGSHWVEETKLLPSDGDLENMFGESVSIDGIAIASGA